jgi:hypothetical protein
MIAANFIPNAMLRILKNIICAMLGLAAIQHASGFVNTGPAQAFEIPALDYITQYWYDDTEMGAPQNFDEGSRLNVPILTYAYDATFLEFFGTQGVAAVDAAMAEMNKLPAASSVKLSNFLTQDNEAINYTAQAIGLMDMKSMVMTLMLEHMGLMGEIHVWGLRAAAPLPSTTCEFEYIVLNWNWDPVTYNPTAYVNGVLYSYSILNGCPIGVAVADAIVYPADLAQGANFTFTAVATHQSLLPGGFYLGVTRDDIGGLAYLYRKNNYAYEILDSNSIAGGFSSSSWSPVSTLVTNAATNGGLAGLFGGVEKITYVKVKYDSLLGTNFTPLLYNYTIPFITNGVLQTLHVTRTVTRPDIVFAAADLSSAPAVYPFIYNGLSRSFTFIPSGYVSAAAGGVTASVISPQELVIFNNLSPIYIDENPSFLDEPTSTEEIVWGSFDGSTNAPIVFPNGTSLNGLMEELFAEGAASTPGTWNPLSALNGNATNATTSGTP